MAIGWYYAHESERLGPFSQQQLKELAAGGIILPTDTVWKEGVEDGVAANLVRNLFVAKAQPATGEATSETTLKDAQANTTSTTEPAQAAAATEQPKSKAIVVKRGTATVVKGAILAGQDGTQARYRMKCSECGHIDASCRTVQITNKLTKANFFCPKCKKRREVAIQCRMG